MAQSVTVSMMGRKVTVSEDTPIHMLEQITRLEAIEHLVKTQKKVRKIKAEKAKARAHMQDMVGSSWWNGVTP